MTGDWRQGGSVAYLFALEQRVGCATHLCPPDFEVAGEGAGADLAEAAGFGEVFNGDNCFCHGLWLMGFKD